MYVSKKPEWSLDVKENFCFTYKLHEIYCRLPDALKWTSSVRSDQAKMVVIPILKNSSDSSHFQMFVNNLGYFLNFKLYGRNFAFVIASVYSIQTERIATLILKMSLTAPFLSSSNELDNIKQ